MQDKLTFKELNVGDTFLLEGTPHVFQKLNVRKRSSIRPFSCNAKAVGTPGDSVKSGWVVEDTPVTKYSWDLKVYVGGISDRVPKGWYHVNSFQGLLTALNDYTVSRISIFATSAAMDSDEQILGALVAEIERRLDSRYVKYRSDGCMRVDEVPIVTVRSYVNEVDEELTKAVQRRLESKQNECMALAQSQQVTQ